MGPFIFLTWPADLCGAAERCAPLAEDLARSEPWRLQAAGPTWRLYSLESRPITLRTLASPPALILGDLFDAAGQGAPAEVTLSHAPTVRAAAGALLDGFWGRYLAVFHGAGQAVSGLLRDPTGLVEALSWTTGGITLVASDLPTALIERFGPGLGLDWCALHALLADPLFVHPDAPLLGMQTLPPGALVEPGGSTPVVSQIWRPAALARGAIGDAGFAEIELRRRVDMAVAAHARTGGPILAEISGGFDSAVVAVALAAASAPAAAWCNHFTADLAGDERRYARTIAEHLGVVVGEHLRPPFVVNPGLIAQSQFGPRPSAFALDGCCDALTVRLAEAAGATRLFTGFGGDGLFFLSPLPAIARDLYLRRGPLALASPDFRDLARWCRKSVWTLARVARQRRHPGLTLHPPAWIAPLDTSGAGRRHPWLDDAEDLPPGKRRHVEEQLLVQLAAGASLRGRALDLVHPLLAQPVVEHCLRIPVDLHVAGGRDRALARRAFQGRLPGAIVQRRSKGELGAYYGRALAAGLPQIRDFLLDGRLRAQGLLNVETLERVLDEGDLAQHGRFSQVLCTVAVEAWVRRWETPSRQVRAD